MDKMGIDLSQWNLYIDDDVAPGPIPDGVPLETMQIVTADCFKEISKKDGFPTGLQAKVESVKMRLYWRRK